MRIFVHDYSGHPFQAQLSRSLGARGHQVVHSTCQAYVSGKGDLSSADQGLTYLTIGHGPVLKHNFVRRTFQELGYGLELIRQLRQAKPQVVLIANAPIPMLAFVTAYLWLRRTPWVLWHQDVQAIALSNFAGDKLSKAWVVAAKILGAAERWCARRAAAIVVISQAFLAVHQQWRTAAKTVVIPNWAPIDEIIPQPRDNDWARKQGIDDRPCLVYSGTLGLKHDPELLPELVARVRERGVDLQLVVINTGIAEDLVRARAAALDVPLTYLPFQPYPELPQVLGTGDVLAVILEQSAGEFSVPSKTLSYLCAGRPIVGLMPVENLAAQLINQVGSRVFAPTRESLDQAAEWLAAVLQDAEERRVLGKQARELAEAEFALEVCTSKFEELLSAAGKG